MRPSGVGTQEQCHCEVRPCNCDDGYHPGSKRATSHSGFSDCQCSSDVTAAAYNSIADVTASINYLTRGDNGSFVPVSVMYVTSTSSWAPSLGVNKRHLAPYELSP